MNKYQTVIDKLDKIPRHYTVVVMVDSLDRVSWFVKDLIPYLKSNWEYSDYVLYGSMHTIRFQRSYKSIKFMTIDTIDMIATPFLLESELHDDLSAVYSKDLQDYIVLDFKDEPNHTFPGPVNQDELMWIFRVMRADRTAEGKKPTYELQGLPDNKALEFTELITPNE